jgi:hypothetical protein
LYSTQFKPFGAHNIIDRALQHLTDFKAEALWKMLISTLYFRKVPPLTRIPQRVASRIALITVFALLLAQIGAMSHAYSHVADLGAAHQTGLGSHKTCNDCLGFAPLLSAGAAPAALPHVEPQGRAVAAPVGGTSFVDRFLTLAFRSRAPPASR